MKKTQRIQTVKKLTAFREKEAVNALGQARQDLALKKARFEELQHFRKDYLRNMDGLGRHGIAGQQLRSYQQFLEQLAVAIQQQQQLVIIATTVVEQKQAAWMAIRQRMQIYDNVEGRYLAEEQKLSDKLEQKQLDEIAGQMKKNYNN